MTAVSLRLLGFELWVFYIQMHNSKYDISDKDLHHAVSVISALANITRTVDLIQLVQCDMLPLLDAYSMRWSLSTPTLNEDTSHKEKKIYFVVCSDKKGTACKLSSHNIHLGSGQLAHVENVSSNDQGLYQVASEVYQKLHFLDPLTSNQLSVLFSKKLFRSRTNVREQNLLNLIQPHFMACLRAIAQNERYNLLVNLSDFFMQKSAATCVVNEKNIILEINTECQNLLRKCKGELLKEEFLSKQYANENLTLEENYRQESKSFYYYVKDFVYQVNINLLNKDEKILKVIQIISAKQDAKVNIKSHPELGITKKEQDILLMILTGLKSADIANCMHISVNTLKTHLRHIHQKCHTRNKTQLINLFIN
jgi:DNA-binding CsgD family transcriptional regulator